jgi:hypothetical protein
MDTKNQYAAGALEHVESIESAIATYNAVKTATDEHRRKLEEAQRHERDILAEIGSDIEDAAERLIMDSAIVRILLARSDDGKVKLTLEELANIVIKGESFAMGAALRIERTRLAKEIEQLCSAIEITVNRAPKSVTDLARKKPRVVEAAQLSAFPQLVASPQYSRGILDPGQILQHAERVVERLKKLTTFDD